MGLGALAIVATMLASEIAPQSAPDATVLAAIRATYSFKPHELTDKQQTKQSKVLDAFWGAATKDPARYLPAIRAELAGDRQLPFFYFDAGRLLMQLSSERADHALVLAALARADLQDVQPLVYVQEVNGFAREGLDTSPAAFKILADPKFVAYVPEHALELHHGDALRFMLLPSANPAIAPAVVARFAAEKTAAAKHALLTLAFDLAPDGDALVRRVAADEKEVPAVRTHAQSTVKLMSQIAAARDAYDLLALVTDKPPAAVHPKDPPPGVPKTAPETLAARRKAAGRISDEALDDIEMDTMLLRMYLAHDAAKPR